MIKSYTSWQPLQEIWIGGVYPEKFYSHLDNEVEDSFCKITELTTSAFKKFSKKLEEFDVKVCSPQFTDDVQDYMKDGILLKPPVAPRDWGITMGDELWLQDQSWKVHPFQNMIEQYKSNGYKIAQINSNDPRWHLEFPNIVRMGKSILIDSYNDDSNRPTPYTHSRQNSFREQINKFIKPIFTDIEWIEDGGHWDSMMCIMKPGYLLYSHWLQSQFSDITLDQHLSKRFFNWKKDLVHKKNIPGNGKWWTAETNYQNATFNHYVMEKAKNWIGDSSETVFEVNMLVIDEQNVICINENNKVFKQLEANGITPHVVNFPTRHFWDGGWHCNTLDIRRKGNQENYFSE